MRALAATASIGGSSFVKVERRRSPSGGRFASAAVEGATSFQDTDPMWKGVPTVLMHSQWEHICSAFENGGSVSRHVSKAIGRTSATQAELSIISLAARFSFRSARVLPSRP